MVKHSLIADDYVKKIVQLNTTVTEFNNALIRFRTGVKYFYNERPRQEQEEILQLARQADSLKIDTKSAGEHERKIKEFYQFTVDVSKLAQIKPEPCPELDKLVLQPQGADSLVPAFEEAGKKLAEARNCYANLMSNASAKADVSIRVSPGGDDAWFVLQECGWKEEIKKRKEALDKKTGECRKKYPEARP